MRQFFETYRGDEKVTPLLIQLPWTHNLVILTQAKRAEEREFYLRMAVQQRWGSRELERQFRLGAFEQAVLAPAKVSSALTQSCLRRRKKTWPWASWRASTWTATGSSARP